MFGVFVGRMCPIHVGHEAVIREMMRACGGERHCLIVLGSSTAEFSMRNFFSLGERVRFLARLFPTLRVAGLPDYGDDATWMAALDVLLFGSGVSPGAVTFFGGCEEDVRFFFAAGRRVEILNRFDGTTPRVSATEVRDALITGRLLDGLVNPEIAWEVQEAFRRKRERLSGT